jgi:hypothetical protein
MFYAWGLRWLDFIGFTYVVDPGPGPGLGLAGRPASHDSPAPPPAPGTTGMLDISTGIIPKTTGHPHKAHGVK